LFITELAGKDARKQKGNGAPNISIQEKWIANVVSTVQRNGSTFKWGKQWKEIQEYFKEQKEKKEEHNPENLLRFKDWSTTRFSAYFENYLHSFRNNYTLVYDKVGGKEVSTAEFVLGLNFL
jgi:hypothetical protein